VPVPLTPRYPLGLGPTARVSHPCWRISTSSTTRPVARCIQHCLAGPHWKDKSRRREIAFSIMRQYDGIKVMSQSVSTNPQLTEEHVFAESEQTGRRALRSDRTNLIPAMSNTSIGNDFAPFHLPASKEWTLQGRQRIK
jgi:hypothetical protein